MCGLLKCFTKVLDSEPPQKILASPRNTIKTDVELYFYAFIVLSLKCCCALILVFLSYFDAFFCSSTVTVD